MLNNCTLMNSTDNKAETYSVNESTIYKKANREDSRCTIGDKVEMRVCYLPPGGEVVELPCVEFAKNSSNDKYFADNRKVLREAKVNEDRFYRNPFMKSAKKSHIRPLHTNSRHCRTDQLILSCG